MSNGLWCSSCGHPAELLGPSLDPDHPLVLCQRVNGAGHIVHPAPVPGICDSAELGEVMREHQAEKARINHRKHTAYLVKSCPHCQRMRAAWPTR